MVTRMVLLTLLVRLIGLVDLIRLIKAQLNWALLLVIEVEYQCQWLQLKV